MKQKLLIACIAILAVAAIAFGALYFTNDADKTKAIEGKDSEIAVLTGEKETLTAEKDQLLADHADAIAAKDGEIAALTADKEALAVVKDQLTVDHAAAIEAKDADIAALTADKEALAMDHAAVIEAKDGEINTLMTEKAELEKSVEDLNNLKHDLIDEKVALEETVKGKDDEIVALTAEKEQLALDYAAAVEQKDGEIAALTGEKDALTAEKEQLIADHAAVIEQKDGEIAALTADKEALTAEKEKLTADYEAAIAEKDNAIAQLQGQLDAAAVPETKADTIEEAIVGDWVMSWDSEGIAAVLNADPDQVENFRAMGVEVMMSFDGKGISTLSVWVLGQRLEDSVAHASYEIMGDQIRTGSKTHGLQIEGDTMTLVTDKGTVILNRK